jgi:hypothetical protein
VCGAHGSPADQVFGGPLLPVFIPLSLALLGPRWGNKLLARYVFGSSCEVGRFIELDDYKTTTEATEAEAIESKPDPDWQKIVTSRISVK